MDSKARACMQFVRSSLQCLLLPLLAGLQWPQSINRQSMQPQSIGKEQPRFHGDSGRLEPGGLDRHNKKKKRIRSCLGGWTCDVDVLDCLDMEDDCSLMFRAAPKARRKVGAKYQSKVVEVSGTVYALFTLNVSKQVHILHFEQSNNLKFYQYIKISIFILLTFAPLN